MSLKYYLMWSNIMKISKNIRSILSSGIYLYDELVVDNWGLNKKQALEALNKFKKLGIAVLGGDVVKIIDGLPTYSCECWVCDKYKDESFKDYSIKSILKAKKYIENYKNTDNTRYVLIALEEDQRLQFKKEVKTKFGDKNPSCKYFLENF